MPPQSPEQPPVPRLPSSQFIIFGIARHTWVMFAAVPIGCVAGMAVPVIRSLTAATVATSERASVFAGLAAAETLIGIIGPLLLNSVYSATIGSVPGAVFFLGTAITLPSFVWLTVHLHPARIVAAREASEMALRRAQHGTSVQEPEECTPLLPSQDAQDTLTASSPCTSPQDAQDSRAVCCPPMPSKGDQDTPTGSSPRSTPHQDQDSEQ